jgi:hypothetical protein
MRKKFFCENKNEKEEKGFANGLDYKEENFDFKLPRYS